MMNYIPGQIHENFQKEHFFLVNNDFNWINCTDKRWGEISTMTDWDESETIELKNGDIIVVRFFKNSPTSNAYTYLERVIHSNGDITEYKTESLVSLALIEKNLDPGKFQNKSWLFSDAKKIIERERKLESILC
jgi:hypothetical protein